MTYQLVMCPVCWLITDSQGSTVGADRGRRYVSPHPRYSVANYPRCGGSLREVPTRPWWQK